MKMEKYSKMDNRNSIILLFGEYDEIKIPIIQRDYAQGRASAEEIRKNFLNAIKDRLNQGVHLDFIYGSVENHGNRKVLILLDGQQRITTLFLLYWYSAIREGKLNEFQKYFCKENKSKLRYEVRASSEEFLDYLSDPNIEINLQNNSKPSEIIKDRNRFYLGWSYDPTISGMLNMIDEIHKTFNDVSQLFDLLYNDQKITFDFLEMKDFGLTDDLYIKMNSRGKLLTPYEHFKAQFEKLIKEKFKEKFMEIAQKFEKEYVDIFWNYAKQEQDPVKLTDEYMYSFFYNLTLNLYAIDNIHEEKLDGFQSLSDFINANSLVSFFEKVYNKDGEIENLIEFLNFLCHIKELPDPVKDILKENPTFQERIRFHAYYLGVLKHKEDKHWYRVLKNLINNTIIDSLEDYGKALKAVEEFSNRLREKEILTYLIESGETFVDFFSKTQRQEEVLKAKLILENRAWEKEIIEAEKHWYLDGKIGFLIQFSENNDNYNLEKFKIYRDKFMKLWDAEFIKPLENQILLWQALLTKGDYLRKVRPYKYETKTFYSFDKDIRSKSENWHRVFDSDKKIYLKELLDDLNLNNANDVKNELENVINKSEVKDWRRYLIDDVGREIIKQFKQLRRSDNDLLIIFNYSEVYLYKGRRSDSYHTELHLFYFFRKCFDLEVRGNDWVGKKPCAPFSESNYLLGRIKETGFWLKGYKYKEGDKEYNLALWITYKEGVFHFSFHKIEDGEELKLTENDDPKTIFINGREVKKEGTFPMPEHFENCWEWLLEQISKKPVEEEVKNPSGGE
jgi:hypothetical protein